MVRLPPTQATKYPLSHNREIRDWFRRSAPGTRMDTNENRKQGPASPLPLQQAVGSWQSAVGKDNSGDEAGKETVSPDPTPASHPGLPPCITSPYKGGGG